MRPFVALVFAVGGMAAACGGPSGQAPLMVFAASSLATPLEELAVLHELRGRQAVRLHLGASGTLARQIRDGAPADLFISADERLVEALATRGTIDPTSRVVVAANTLALVVVDDRRELTVSSLDDLVRDTRVQIGIGDPDVVPVGRYAREWLQGVGAWEPLLARRALVLAPTAQAVIAQVRAGATDAAVVFRSDAVTTTGLRVVAEAPAGATTPIRYVGGVLASATSRQAAIIFLDILAGPEGQRVLADAGFVPAGTPGR